MKPFKSKEFCVYVHDTDVAGVVHHSNYLRYFEAGRIEFLRDLGYPYIQLQKQGIGFVPVDVQLKYHRPLRQDDRFVVTVESIQSKGASFCIVQHIECQGEIMVSATILLACVEEPEFKPRRIPEDILRAFKA